FRPKLANYFMLEKEVRSVDDMGDTHFSESKEFDKARSEINRLVPRLHAVMNQVGQPTHAVISPPAATGGLAGPVHIFSNLVRRHHFNIDEGTYFDLLDHTLGRYDVVLPGLKRKLYNPFYWIFERGLFPFIRYCIELPGFNYSRIENSFWDKIIKTITLLTALGGLVKWIFELTKL
ncbi:unnamed protein product, partial [marine sediment metagenome]